MKKMKKMKKMKQMKNMKKMKNMKQRGGREPLQSSKHILQRHVAVAALVSSVKHAGNGSRFRSSVAPPQKLRALSFQLPDLQGKVG